MCLIVHGANGCRRLRSSLLFLLKRIFRTLNLLTYGDECRKINPAIEVLPWEYNIDFRPSQTEIKAYGTAQLPLESIRTIRNLTVNWASIYSTKLTGRTWRHRTTEWLQH